MIIARERYLDDTSEYHLTIALATRTGAMHSLLSNVPDHVREAIGATLARALDEIQQQLTPHLGADKVSPLGGRNPEP